jgi:hypothetical protein
LFSRASATLVLTISAPSLRFINRGDSFGPQIFCYRCDQGLGWLLLETGLSLVLLQNYGINSHVS